MVVGDPGPLACDGVIDTGHQVWTGVGGGWGRLEQRVVEVTAAGRRLPGKRRRKMEFPVPELQNAEVDNAERGGVAAERAPSINQLSAAS